MAEHKHRMILAYYFWNTCNISKYWAVLDKIPQHMDLNSSALMMPYGATCSILFQVIAWCLTATSHYINQINVDLSHELWYHVASTWGCKFQLLPEGHCTYPVSDHVGEMFHICGNIGLASTCPAVHKPEKFKVVNITINPNQLDLQQFIHIEMQFKLLVCPTTFWFWIPWFESLTLLGGISKPLTSS